MRLVKVLFAAMIAIAAVMAGLIAAAALAVTGLVAVLLGRWLRLPRRSPPPKNQVETGATRGDVIDVTATEVRSERLP